MGKRIQRRVGCALHATECYTLLFFTQRLMGGRFAKEVVCVYSVKCVPHVGSGLLFCLLPLFLSISLSPSLSLTSFFSPSPPPPLTFCPGVQECFLVFLCIAMHLLKADEALHMHQTGFWCVYTCVCVSTCCSNTTAVFQCNLMILCTFYQSLILWGFHSRSSLKITQ